MPVFTFIRGFEEHYTCFRLLFNESVTNPSEEVIHRMRVEMKYLVTLLNLIEELSPETVDNDYQTTLKRIAKRSGKIRDWQIIKALFESHPMYANIEMAESINQKIERQQEKYGEFATSITLAKNITDSIGLRQLTVTQESVTSYIDDLRIRAEELLKAGIENRELWHKARHQLKRIYFLMNLANELFGKCFQHHEVAHYKYAEQLLGRWHDMTLVIDFCENKQLPICDADSNLMAESEKEIMNSLVMR